MAVSEQLREWVREDAHNRCGYCLSHQDYQPQTLEIEHLIPPNKGGTDERGNLWLACRTCNLRKSDRIYAIDPLSNQTVHLFNPRQQIWEAHFKWNREGTHIEGLTAIGRATVQLLQMNNQYVVIARRNWVSAGWHPPS